MQLSIFKRGAPFLAILFGVVIVHAFVPQWWAEQGVIPDTIDQTDLAVIQDNYKPALIGQAKHMAYQAYIAMEAQQTDSAGANIENLVTNFSTDPADNYAPLLLGQLKAIAQPFYDRFDEFGYNLGDINVNASGYPWDDNAAMEDNYKPANLGQLKYVFSFDLASFPPNVDGDGDGISDSWEIIYFGDLDEGALGDPDGDQLTNLDEFNYGTLPNDEDTDNDGFHDGNDITPPQNPLKKDHSAVGLVVF